MTRYLHWTLPIIMPFAIVAMMRAVVWAAGGEWIVADLIVPTSAMAIIFGGFGGVLIASEIERHK